MTTQQLQQEYDLSQPHEQITLYSCANKYYLYPPGMTFIACIFSKDIIGETGVAYVDNQPIKYEIGNNPHAENKLYRSEAVKPCIRHKHL
jgi:hypothetical protein